MAVTFKDGVILGADSRTTTGAYIANRVTDKLTKVHDKIWCCRSGSAADTQAVADIVQYHLELYTSQYGEPTTKVAASIFKTLCYENKDHLTAGIIVAGYDEKTKERCIVYLLVVLCTSSRTQLLVLVLLSYMVTVTRTIRKI